MLLKSSEMRHYNCISLLKDDNLQTDDASICTEYIEFTEYNNEKLNKKNKDFNIYTNVTVLVIIGIIVLNFMSKFVK